MSKMKQIAALTAMLVGVIMYASPAKSAVCFLPDDDGSCGGGDIEISDGSDSDDNKPEEKCDGFTVSATEYNKMKNCFDFTSCTKSKTKEVKYKKGAQKENTTWSNGICCTNGEKYFSKQGQCCPTTGCACSGGRVWNPSTEQCECPEGKEFVGGVCTCKEGTIPDGTGCKIDNSPKCNDINPHYFPMSDTAKYNECKRLDEYYNDNDLFVMETTNVTGSDGKCFYCHHRTCAEIAEYVEAGEKYYTSCKNTEIAEKASYSPGSDGQCYTCRAKTCRDYAKEFNKTYVMEDDDAACEKATGRHADVFDVIEREFAADGQCYECKLLKCNEISDIYGTKDMQCPAGYLLEEEDNYIAEDGQCYYCRKSKVYVVFDYELQGNSDAGQYNECIWSGTGNTQVLDWTNQMYYCSRSNYGEDYNVGDYYDPMEYYRTCKHTSDWYAYLTVDGGEVTGFNSKTWTLPFDMEMVVTYDIPYIMWDRCPPTKAPEIRFAPKGAIQTYPEIFAPRTVRMKFPKGSKVDAVMRKQPVDYLDGITEDHLTIEYYVNGQKISGDSITIDDVSYSFNGTWN